MVDALDRFCEDAGSAAFRVVQGAAQRLPATQAIAQQLTLRSMTRVGWTLKLDIVALSP